MSHRLRVQRTRTKGGGMPVGAVYCGRPGLFGNPFSGTAHSRNVELFAMWMRGELPEVEPERREMILKRLPELRGKRLACWCSLDKVCHVDVLCELANVHEVSCLITLELYQDDKTKARQYLQFFAEQECQYIGLAMWRPPEIRFCGEDSTGQIRVKITCDTVPIDNGPSDQK